MSREQQNTARDLMQQSQWQQAITALNQARQDDAENPWILGSLAFCHSRLKQYKEAIELYERMCKMQPTVARWPYGLGYQYYDQQDWARAIEYFDRALKIEPEYLVVLYRKGYALSRLDGKQGEALTTLEHCRQSYLAMPDGEEKDKERKTYADACYQQGKIFLDGNKASLALERLREAATINADEADIHYSVGKAYLALSRWDEAMASLKTALRLSAHPQHYLLDAIAQAHTGAGQLDEAIKAYEQMDYSVRGRPYILRNMGTVYAKLEQYDKAESTLQEAVRKEPGNHNGHYRLGWVYEQLQKWVEASGEYKTAIDLRQRNYGLSFPDAEKALDKLVSEHPEAKDAPRPRPPAPVHSALPNSEAERADAVPPERPDVPVRSAYPPRQAAPVRPTRTPRSGAPEHTAYPPRQGAPVRPAQSSYPDAAERSTSPSRQAAPVRPAQTRTPDAPQRSAYPSHQASPVRPAQTRGPDTAQRSAYTPRPAAPRASSSVRTVGRVKAFFADKGFGFIEVSGQPDLFFHISQVQGSTTVQIGDEMEYSVGQGPRGPIAVELRAVTQKTS